MNQHTKRHQERLTMTKRKLVVICKNCHCRLGITFEPNSLDIFCTDCEAAECSRQEKLEELECQYRVALASI